MATVEIDKMKSRMGRATESHFAVLNTKIIERKAELSAFDPSKVLNPALRATIREEPDNKADFIKVKALFMGEEQKKRLSLHNRQFLSKADQAKASEVKADAETAATTDEATLATDAADKNASVKKQKQEKYSRISEKQDKSQNLKPSFTFLAKKRAPYSYIKPAEAPPVALYTPNYEALDREETQTHIDARLGNSVDIRHSYKPKPQCLVVGQNQCSWKVREHIREMKQSQ